MERKRPRQTMPAEVARRLEAAGLADAYAERPFYQRNDYLSWIKRAKRPETREKRLQQMLDELAEQYEGRAKIAHMDVQTNAQTICSLGVDQLPAVLVFQNGHVVDRLVGECPRGVYCSALDGTLVLNWVI